MHLPLSTYHLPASHRVNLNILLCACAHLCSGALCVSIVLAISCELMQLPFYHWCWCCTLCATTPPNLRSASCKNWWHHQLTLSSPPSTLSFLLLSSCHVFPSIYNISKFLVALVAKIFKVHLATKWWHQLTWDSCLPKVLLTNSVLHHHHHHHCNHPSTTSLPLQYLLILF